VSGKEYDISSEGLHYSIAEYNKLYSPKLVDVPDYFDADLKEIFQRRSPRVSEDQWESAPEFLKRNRRLIAGNISYWTGLNDAVVRSLMIHFIEHCKHLDLWVDPDKTDEILIEVTAYATTLCMNKLYKGDFIIK
jgi:hypothetical protein